MARAIGIGPGDITNAGQRGEGSSGPLVRNRDLITEFPVGWSAALRGTADALLQPHHQTGQATSSIRAHPPARSGDTPNRARSPSPNAVSTHRPFVVS